MRAQRAERSLSAGASALPSRRRVVDKVVEADRALVAGAQSRGRRAPCVAEAYTR